MKRLIPAARSASTSSGQAAQTIVGKNGRPPSRIPDGLGLTVGPGPAPRRRATSAPAGRRGVGTAPAYLRRFLALAQRGLLDHHALGRLLGRRVPEPTDLLDHVQSVRDLA